MDLRMLRNVRLRVLSSGHMCSHRHPVFCSEFLRLEATSYIIRNHDRDDSPKHGEDSVILLRDFKNFFQLLSLQNSTQEHITREEDRNNFERTNVFKRRIIENRQVGGLKSSCR
jgi:hypothetical protein